MKLDFLAAGCNNETGIFDEFNGYILYAAGRNVLITQIPNSQDNRICALPNAPSGRVHSCQWISTTDSLGALVASDDGFLRYYQCKSPREPLIHSAWTLKSTINLESSVTLASHFNGFHVVAATVKGQVFHVDFNTSSVQLVKSYAPKKITALTVGILPSSNDQLNTHDPFILAALSDSNIRVLLRNSETWNEALSVSGHQNCITSLSVRSQDPDTVYILSSSLDKTIRVWKISPQQQEIENKSTLSELVPQKNSFVNRFGTKFTLVADSLALGHENAVYFARFLKTSLNPSSSSDSDSLEIISGSSDRSLIVWSRGFGGAWRTALQLGDLNGSLGTIGTDHTFSFYGGCVYQGTWIAAAASTGSILFWKREQEGGEWIPQAPITGHTDRVESLTWNDPQDTGVQFLITASKDQTTRVFAPLTSGSFREIARPQIHGYDLKCIAISSFSRGHVQVYELISGADEKVLRVFQAPKQFYAKLNLMFDELVPESAQLPALGLSNKTNDTVDSSNAVDSTLTQSNTNGDLVRNSLWPEIDKLYGHNQEISALALSPNRKFMASAAKSHLAADAALRLWTCCEKEGKWLPAAVVPAHTLTVSRLVFSPNSLKLLSVSRDRNLCLIDPQTGNILCRLEAHARMIFAADWITENVLVTGSRDKTVKIWRIAAANTVSLVQTITFETGITALSTFKSNILAVGDENGNIFIYKSEEDTWSPAGIEVKGGGGLGPADSITDLKWNNSINSINAQLAVASADNSIRILSFYL